MGILFRELATLYRDFCAGHPSTLPPLPLQYADYSAWQRQGLQGVILEQRLTYWCEQLRGLTPLTLPTDHPRPTMQTFHGKSLSFELSTDLTHALKTVTRNAGCTLFMTLLTAFHILLHRYSGQDDISVGSPIAGRIRKEFEDTIGLFINTLVLRANLRCNPTFRELLLQVKDTALGAYTHQEIPFEQLVEELKPERNPQYSPLFQVLFVLQNNSPSPWTLPGLTISPVASPRQSAMFDITLAMAEVRGGLRGSFNYNTDLFDQSTMARMVQHFETLLDSIVSDPDQRIADLNLLPAPERQQLLEEWNGSRTASIPPVTVVQLFEDQVARTPEAQALCSEGCYLTYAELNAQANQLARYLQQQGIGPEFTVGVCLERSPVMIITVLAILKAGGAYVPLDPAYPTERLTYMMTDAQIAVLVTYQTLRERFPELIVPVLALDAETDRIRRKSTTNLNHELVPENLAYIIFTSGSTGTPKGVMIQHHSLVNFVHTAHEDYTFGSDDRILQFASLSFDASAEEIFPCLTSGGTLVLRSDAMLDSWTGFLDHCQNWGLTVLDLPTAYWHELVQAMAEDDLTFPPSMRLVIIGGERVQPERLVQWHTISDSSIRLINTYGPTEGTIVAVSGELTALSSHRPTDEVSLGTPLTNSQVYVLDRKGQPVPMGVPGELYLAGVGLARGYLKRPELSAEKFLPDPFGTNPGARVYRTGDLVRHRDDGTLQFLGRVDHQVKLRGFRIELGEIEARFAQHPAIHEARVMVREDETDNPCLVAYLVFATDRDLSVKELRSFLQQQLPDFMIPSTFVTLETFPLTPNGKVDRRRLPAPERTRGNLGTSLVAPQTPTEQELMVIWKEVLGLEEVWIHDNFFDLGGHSLLATQMVSRLRKVFQIELLLRSVFEHPTLESLAQQIEGQIIEEISAMSEEEVEAYLEKGM